MNINSLPLEIFQEILKYLCPEEKIKASVVCQKWHRVTLSSVDTLFCYDQDSANTRYRDRCYDLCPQDDLWELKKFYEETLKKKVNWWDLLVLLPKVKYLQIMVPELEEGILEAISRDLSELEHLVIFVDFPPEGYDWKMFGAKLTKLVSFKVYFAWEYSEGDFAQMLPFCSNLTKICVEFSTICDTWNKVIPKRVTDVRLVRCRDDRTDSEGSLCSFIFEDPTRVCTFFWEEEDFLCQLREVDITPLTNVKHLELDTGSSLHVAVFEYCKAVEELFISCCSVKQFSRPKHVLPHLKKFTCRKFCGNTEDLKPFCPNVRELSCDPCE